MPELRVLCLESIFQIQCLDRYILPFTHTGPAFIFPDLEVLEFQAKNWERKGFTTYFRNSS